MAANTIPPLLNIRKDLPPGFIRDALAYDPITGVFLWLKTHPRFIGKRAGTITKTGHRQIVINYKPYLAGRLAWVWMTGEWPTEEIDHKNCNSGDDSWRNLRQSSRAENSQNRRIYPSNTSGYKGVSWRKDHKKWCATITSHGQKYFLGFFDDPLTAHAAYRRAAKRLHGEFARPQ